MEITFTTLLVWLLIAALVGIVGELIARHFPDCGDLPLRYCR